VIWTPESDARLLEAKGKGLSWAEISAALSTSIESARTRYRTVLGRHRSSKLAPPDPNHVTPDFPEWNKPERPNWREWLDLFERVNQMYVRSNAIVEYLTIDLSKLTTPMVLASASDLHMGSGFTNHRELRRTLEYILETPGLYVGVCGDSIEGFIPGTHGAATSEQMAGSVSAQLFAMESLVDEFTANGKLLYWTWGDHDAKWFEDRVGSNVVAMLLDRKVPYFSGRGLIKLLVGGQTYYLHINHAERYKSLLNATHPQRRMYELVFPADVSISGHLHKPAYHVEHFYDMAREFGLDFGGKAIFVQNGTFKTGPDAYTIRSWTRGIVGVPSLVFRPDYHEKDVFDSPWKAVQYVGGTNAPAQV